MHLSQFHGGFSCCLINKMPPPQNKHVDHQFQEPTLFKMLILWVQSIGGQRQIPLCHSLTTQTSFVSCRFIAWLKPTLSGVQRNQIDSYSYEIKKICKSSTSKFLLVLIYLIYLTFSWEQGLSITQLTEDTPHRPHVHCLSIRSTEKEWMLLVLWNNLNARTDVMVVEMQAEMITRRVAVLVMLFVVMQWN